MVPRGVDPGQPAGEGFADRDGAVAPGADMQRTHQSAGEQSGAAFPASRPEAVRGRAGSRDPVARNTAAVAAVASNDNFFLMVGSRGVMKYPHR